MFDLRSSYLKKNWSCWIKGKRREKWITYTRQRVSYKKILATNTLRFLVLFWLVLEHEPSVNNPRDTVTVGSPCEETGDYVLAWYNTHTENDTSWLSLAYYWALAYISSSQRGGNSRGTNVIHGVWQLPTWIRWSWRSWRAQRSSYLNRNKNFDST